MKEISRFELWLIRVLSRWACEHKKVMPDGRCWYCGKKLKKLKGGE